MAFPANASDIEVSVAYGANLASDLTTLTYSPNLALTHVQPRMVITRGRIAGAGRTQPTTIDFGLKNPQGVFSPRNITGPHYGQLRRNTPVRGRVDPGTGMVTRGIAYIPDWPVRWTGPDIDDRIPMQASGALRRLGAGSEHRSALRRTILAYAQNPIAYWPMEDDSGSTQVAAGISGGVPMSFTAGAFATTTGPGGATAALDLSAGPTLTAPTIVSSATSWRVEFAAKIPPLASLQYSSLIQVISTNGFVLRAVASYVPSWIVDIQYAGLLTSITDLTQVADGQWHHFAATATQSGGNTFVEAWLDGVLKTWATFSVPFAPVAGVVLTPSQNYGFNVPPSAMTHAGVWAPNPGVLNTARATSGYSAELAATRVARLCAEDGIATDVTAGRSEPMGPQLAGTLPDLLRECEDSDEAVIVERRTGVLGFDPRVSRYNRAVTMTVNYLTQVADLLPGDDDRDLRNYVTVNRIGGSSGTVQRTAGPLGTDKATGVDRYPDQASRSLATDPQAVHHAGWLTNIGTVDEPRYVVGINLRAHPELVAQWLACDIGSRILINNPPAIQVGPAPLDLIIEGYQELIDGVEWYVTLYVQPYRPYEVFQIETGTGNRSRIAAGVSTTDLAYSATATSLSVTSASVRWIDSATYPSKFPILVECAGEVMTCTAIVGTGLTQTFTVSRGLHGIAKPLPITSQVQIWRAPAIAL